MKALFVLATSAVMATSVQWSALAVPQFEFHITGEYTNPAASSQIDDSSFFISYTSAGTNGGQDIYTTPFNITRSEIFSDPDVTMTPLLYADIQTFGYFGLLSTFDANDDPIDRSFVIAAQPGTIAGESFSVVFADYLTNNPLVTSLADFITILDQGPDFPTQGAGLEWIDFNNNVVGSNSIGSLAGLVGTTFQTGETLDLIVFDNGTGIGSSIGTIAVAAVEVPEPASALALLLPASFLLRRRRFEQLTA